MSDPAFEKAELRKAILAELRAITPDERAARSMVICQRVQESHAWQRSDRVLLFTPLRSEPDIAVLHAAAEQSGKQVEVIPSDARVEAELVLRVEPHLILVPGLAFSLDGHRMGRGGGFYDRLLAGRAKAALKVGICFRLQLRSNIPHQSHDVILDSVISD